MVEWAKSLDAFQRLRVPAQVALLRCVSNTYHNPVNHNKTILEYTALSETFVT